MVLNFEATLLPNAAQAKACTASVANGWWVHTTGRPSAKRAACSDRMQSLVGGGAAPPVLLRPVPVLRARASLLLVRGWKDTLYPARMAAAVAVGGQTSAKTAFRHAPRHGSSCGSDMHLHRLGVADAAAAAGAAKHACTAALFAAVDRAPGIQSTAECNQGVVVQYMASLMHGVINARRHQCMTASTYGAINV
jgi:hypothetical protein